MKILFTTFAYYPERNGIPSVVKYLAEGLRAKGHTVCIATCFNGNKIPSEEIINDIEVRRFDLRQDLLKRNVGDIKGYVNFVKSYGQDVLIMECLQCNTTDILLPHLRELHCKIFIHAHGAPGIFMKPFKLKYDFIHTIGNTYNWYRLKKYYNKYFPKYAKYINGSISCSVCASDLEYFTKHIRNNYIIENSADSMFFENISINDDIIKQLGIKTERYIVNIATLNDRKNQLELEDVFAEADIKDATLVIIGVEKNNYYYKLLDKANVLKKERGCDIKIFDKSITRDMFPYILKGATLFVTTSKWEEYPIALVESMAIGTPFISSPVGNAHILPGGLTARTKSEFVSLLKILLSDEQYVQRLSKQAIDYSKTNNNPEEIIRRLETIINANK